MNILVTAGNTQARIDRVRCLTNIFSGRTGAGLALSAYQRGHHVTLLTSRPEAVAELGDSASFTARWQVRRYSTLDDLQKLMAHCLSAGHMDALIHSAAVSDYQAAGVYAPAPGVRFDSATRTWGSDQNAPAVLNDIQAGKIKSDYDEVWIRLVRAPKLIDMVRPDWGFQGVLVKFKLEADMGDEELLLIAEASRRHSSADLMVANTLEGAGSWAYLGPLAGRYERVARRELGSRLLEAVEQVHEGRSHG